MSEQAVTPMQDPDSEENRISMEENLSPMELAFSRREYVPGMLEWMSEIERNHVITDLRSKVEDPDSPWLEAAIASIDKSRGYEEDAVSTLLDAGVAIPPDDPLYQDIMNRYPNPR